MSEIDETVVVPKKQYDEMVENLADKTQSTANLVNEIKELREKKQLTEAQVEDLTKKLEQREAAPADATTELTPEKIAEIARTTMRTALAEKDAETAKSNRESAMTEFLSKHKEFHPDNDVGGIKLAALERKFAQFNTNTLKSTSDFLSVLEDASHLVSSTPAPKVPGSDPNPPAPNGTRDGTIPPEVNEDKSLSVKELNIIDRTFGGDKERYLKIRAKRPDYVATLLQYSI